MPEPIEREPIDLEAVERYLLGLQDRLSEGLAALDGGSEFAEESWERAAGGGGRTRTLAEGALFEKGGVNYSHVFGEGLPPAASALRPDLAGRSFRALGVSLVLHPRSPYVPTSHMNVRFFLAERDGEAPIWWFGGGFDLTPYYGFEEDAQHWHEVARRACEPHGESIYPRFKKACDDYFFLPHRGETRGVGGLFYDDFNELGFGGSFGLTRSVGDAFLEAYAPIAERRRDDEYGEGERAWQLYRRGRYVEFNLLYDRGTLFGIQSGGRTESILMSLPPLVRWEYGFTAPAGSAEARLAEDFLRPRDWLGGG